MVKVMQLKSDNQTRSTESSNRKQAHVENSFEKYNTKMLNTVAESLGSMRSQVVFLGGTILPLLLTRPEAQISRRSKDVDFIFRANSRQETYDFEDGLWDKGFTKTKNGVVCCWKIDGVRIDVLPSNPNIVMFKNRWCNEACDKYDSHHFDSNKAIRVISAPVFLATKFEAFSRRGRHNYLTSYDIADVFLVLGGRPQITSDIDNYASEELKMFLAEEFIKLQKVIKDTGELLPEPLQRYKSEVNECIKKIVSYKKLKNKIIKTHVKKKKTVTKNTTKSKPTKAK